MAEPIALDTKTGKKSRSNKATESEMAKTGKKRKHSVVVHQNGDGEEEDTSIFDMQTNSQSPQSKRGFIKPPPSKKRRSGAEDPVTASKHEPAKDLQTSKPSALFKPRRARDWTLSIAVPGSIIANVIKPDLKTMLAGRIARAAAVFCVDEIVVFDDDPSNIPDYVDKRYKQKRKSKQEVLESISENDQPWQNPDQFLYHVLSYAECPPYLRRDTEYHDVSLFNEHQNLKWAGVLPSLDMPHHLKSHEWCRYREGVTLGPAAARSEQTPKSKDKKRKSKTQTTEEEQWTYVKCGLPYPVKVPLHIPPAMRVTLKFKDPEAPTSWPHLSHEECENLEVEAIAPTAPREEEGFYWGYTVRRATSLSDVFVSCEFPDGYDVSIGTSERGASLSSVLPYDITPPSQPSQDNSGNEQELPSEFKHLLLVFGGVAGLEPAVASDPEFKDKGLTKETAHAAFDAWVNLVQGQGSRTIRTEEAVEFGLFGLKGYVDSMYN